MPAVDHADGYENEGDCKGNDKEDMHLEDKRVHPELHESLEDIAEECDEEHTDR